MTQGLMARRGRPPRKWKKDLKNIVPLKVNPNASVEEMAFQDLQFKRLQVHYCKHCKEVVDTENPEKQRAVKKKKHVQMACRQCHNLVTQMYKNWDMKQLSLKNMSEEETTQFFKDAKTFCGGSFAKGKVRALLEKKLIQYETNQVETKVRGKFLPLSVYEKKATIQNASKQRQSA